MRVTRKHRGIFALACLCGLALAALAGGTTSGAAGAGPACPNEASRQGASAVLAECRAYEMVSPPQKLGSDVMIDATRTRASTDGDALGFASLGTFADALGTGISNEYIAERRPGGWQTHSITPPQEPQSGSEAVHTFDPRYSGELSADLGTGVYKSKTSLTADTNVQGAVNLYLSRDLLTPDPGSYELISKAAEPIAGVGEQYLPLFTGASADFSHVSFMSRLNLTADAPAQTCAIPGSVKCEPRVYEWTGGEVRLVGLVPVAPETSCSGTDCVSAIRSVPGQASNALSYSTDTMSRDGQRVFFTVADASLSLSGDLYVREGGVSTTKVNVSERAVPGASQPATFWAASADGSKVVFSTSQQLTDESSSLSVNLYEADLDAPVGARLRLLSVDSEPGDGVGGIVDRVYGVSPDGSYVYFSATSQLVAGEQPREPGDSMVYAWHDGALTFIAPIMSSEDGGENASSSFALSQRPARVSPGGESFLFVSRSPHVAVGSSAECANSLPCRRLYLFRFDGAGAGSLACVSCRPGGAPSSTDALAVPVAATGGSPQDPHLNRPLSEGGRLVFFSTGDRLVPEDTNGRYDAYAYDAATGEAHLISSGRCNCDSYFLEATPDGSDAFFATRQQLVGWDVDGATDVYDARIEGGLPEPPIPPPSCQGDACQPAPLSLNDPTPASAGFAGPGNQKRFKAKARKCPQGKRRVKARGNKTRCVKRSRANGNRGASK